MTSFLDDLERELRAAHPRRKRAARRAAVERNARKAPAAAATVAVLGGATAFVVSTGDEPATHSAAPTGADYPTDRIPSGTIAVLNGTSEVGRAHTVAEFLRPRHRVAVAGDVERVPSGAPTTVYYARGHADDARALAREIGVAWSRMTERIRTAAPGADVTIEVRQDVTGGWTAPLKDPGGIERGSMSTLEVGGRRFVELQTGIKRSQRHAVWLRGPERTKFLGFVAVPVDKQGDTLVVAELPKGDRYPELVLSRETSAEPGDGPAKVLLTAPLE